MLQEYLLIIFLIITGFGTGIVVGIGSGTAGGIMIPLLTILYGSQIYVAIGTSLIVDTFIGGMAGLLFYRKGNVDFKAVALLSVPGVGGALLGSRFTSATPEGDLSLVIGVILIFLGINFLKFGIRKNVEFLASRVNLSFVQKNKTLLFVVFGFIAGIMSGFSGISGGALVALALIFLFGYELHKAIGTSLVMLFFIASAGVIGHYINTTIDVSIGGTIGIFAAGGAFFGSFIANKIDENILGRIIGIAIFVLGVALILKILI
jgi:uncharacterized membrane protein YfcA